jgi:hypothetical protein
MDERRLRAESRSQNCILTFQVGVFADYLRFSQTENSFGGVGARVNFQAYQRAKT